MLRRSLLAVPLLAAGAALLGAWLGSAWLAAGVAIIAAVILESALARIAERRVGGVADQVVRLTDTDGPPAVSVPEQGSFQWQRLTRALNAVGVALQERFDALARERARVEELLERLPPSILLFSGGELSYANASARALFALAGDRRRSPLVVLTDKALADAVAEAAETGRTVNIELQRGNRHLRARAWRTTHGEVALSVSDLTGIRRVEAMRRDFVTNASHELKTPVAGILALSESLGLALNRDPERAPGMATRLQHEAARLGTLVRDLLDLTRLEDETVEEPTAVDVTEIARSEAARLAGTAEQRDVTIQCNCDEPARVAASLEDVRLIIANLLSNAVQYNRPGGWVRISVARKHNGVVIEVSDNGIGISRAHRARIFERFYRVDKARSRAAGGTGLGLSIVRHATTKHGGEVTVQSILGEGSTFRVFLPVEGVTSP